MRLTLNDLYPGMPVVVSGHAFGSQHPDFKTMLATGSRDVEPALPDMKGFVKKVGKTRVRVEIPEFVSTRTFFTHLNSEETVPVEKRVVTIKPKFLSPVPLTAEEIAELMRKFESA